MPNAVPNVFWISRKLFSCVIDNVTGRFACAAHHLIELLDQSSQVEQARVGMVLVQPLHLVQVPPQVLRADAHQRADEQREERQPVHPVEQALHLAARRVLGHFQARAASHRLCRPPRRPAPSKANAPITTGTYIRCR